MSLSETLRIEKTQSLEDPYVTAGNRAYVVGAQHGGFPDMGFHMPGEMGGMWAHPVKLLDGFWLAIDSQWLSKASRFVSGPFWNEHAYSVGDGLEVTRRQFMPDDEPAMVVKYSFRTVRTRQISVRLLARADLRHVWSPNHGREPDAPPRTSYDGALGAWLASSQTEQWVMIVGARDQEPNAWIAGPDFWGPERTQGAGVSLVLDYRLHLNAARTTEIEFVACGSCLGESEALESYRRVRGATGRLWSVKAARVDQVVAQTRLEAPDASIQRAWDWLKCNYDWLYCDTVTAGGLTAGLADYPWWFGCDNAYALLGALALGQHGRTLETLDLLRTASERANSPAGRVIHECTTAGEVVDPGTTAETPHLIATIWQAFCWTGDLDFLRRNYAFCRRGLLDWTLGTQCPGGDLLPTGCGITEQPGLDLQCIDTAVHTVSALEALAGMAHVLADSSTEERCRVLEPLVRARIEDAFWMEDEGLYGDMLATPAEMIPRVTQWQSVAESQYYRGGGDVATYLQHLLDIARADPEPDRRRPWLLKYWIVLAPLEAGIAPPHRAARALARLQSAEFVGAAGMYLSGLDRTHAMSISAGALATAAIRYNRPDHGVDHLRRLTDTLDYHMPGAISEILPAGGCFVQAWSGSAVVWPVVARMFGIEPNAHQRRITISPRFPPNWAGARLSQVRIGESTFDFEWDGATMLVETSDPGWTISSPEEPSLARTSG